MNASPLPVKPLNILLVEDSVMDVNLVRIAFSRRHSTSELTTCKDGESALFHLRQHSIGGIRPDLMILDLNLPGMDGIEVLTECKNDTELKSIPVVVFTSTSLAAEIGRCYAAGAAKVVTKPTAVEPFLGIVQGIEDCLRKKMEGGENLGGCIGGEPNQE